MTDLEAIIDEIMRIDGCETTKRRAVAVLRSQVGRRVYFAKCVLIEREQIALARSMLKSMRRPEVRDALIVRLRVSRDQAYRIINKALNMPRHEQIELI